MRGIIPLPAARNLSLDLHAQNRSHDPAYGCVRQSALSGVPDKAE